MFSGFPQVQSICLRRLFQPRRTEFRGLNCSRGNSDQHRSSDFGNVSDNQVSTMFEGKMSRGFRSIIALIVSRSLSPEVLPCRFSFLEASRSRVGIAERDDILWFRCVVGA